MEDHLITLDIRKKLHSAAGVVDLSISTQIQMGTLVSFFGQSGSGKTTILRMLAGLTNPDWGEIWFGDHCWFDHRKKINLEPQKRNCSLMFQDYALFPNMTVEENIRFAQGGKNRVEVTRLLNLFGLNELSRRKPSELSGGQKQRVGLARALARKPKLLLLDEPLSAVDTSMRSTLQDEILKAHEHLKATTLLVSHDVSEVYRLSDQVQKLEHGTITQVGKPDELFIDHSFSGKVQIVGKVVRIVEELPIFIVTVVTSGNQIVKVTAFESDLNNVKPGDQVMLFTKAFNPIITKLGS